MQVPRREWRRRRRLSRRRCSRHRGRRESGVGQGLRLRRRIQLAAAAKQRPRLLRRIDSQLAPVKGVVGKVDAPRPLSQARALQSSRHALALCGRRHGPGFSGLSDFMRICGVARRSRLADGGRVRGHDRPWLAILTSSLAQRSRPCAFILRHKRRPATPCRCVVVVADVRQGCVARSWNRLSHDAAGRSAGCSGMCVNIAVVIA